MSRSPLDKRRFRAWLHELALAELTAGQAQTPGHCPIARHVLDITDSDYCYALSRELEYGRRYGTRNIQRMQPWARRFIKWADRKGYREPISAREALEAEGKEW